MSEYVYKVVVTEYEAGEVQSVLNKYASKGWELHQLYHGPNCVWIILKGKK
jgi:hypothetical protein